MGEITGDNQIFTHHLIANYVIFGFLGFPGSLLCGPFHRCILMWCGTGLLPVICNHLIHMQLEAEVFQRLWSGWRDRGKFSPGHMLGNVSYMWERLVPCQLSGCFCTKSLWPIKSLQEIAAWLWLGSLFLSQSQRIQTWKRPVYADLVQWSWDVPLAYTSGSQSPVNKVSEFFIRRIKDYFQVNVMFPQLHPDVFSSLGDRAKVPFPAVCVSLWPWAVLVSSISHEDMEE